MSTKIALCRRQSFSNDIIERSWLNQIQISKFSSGEILVKCAFDTYHIERSGGVSVPVLDDGTEKHRLTQTSYFEFISNIQCSDDIIELMLLKDAVQRECIRNGIDLPFELQIPYLPYSRQDRVSTNGESFSLKVIGDLINSMNFRKVTTIDVHSEVADGIIKNFVNILPDDYIHHHLRSKKYDFVVSPDMGYSKKIKLMKNMLDSHKMPVVQAYKQRDPETKDVKKVEIIPNNDVSFHGATALILDDICEDGQTKIAIANALKKRGVKTVDVFSTHGFFTDGAIYLQPHIDYCYSTETVGEQMNGLCRYERPRTKNAMRYCVGKE